LFAKPSPAAKEPALRTEIEGLRAIAAILVAVFHVWVGRVSGGVDVFFVVSSFLITTTLLGQLERTGQIQFARFWARLLKRLLPGSMLVLLTVILASLFLMPKSHWKDTIAQTGAAMLYLENWLLAFQSVDYLAQHSAVSPLQHYWALSVQGQMYVLWPLLFAGAGLLAKRGKLPLRLVVYGLLAVVFTASLAYSIYLTRHNQPFAYFNTFTRMWEFSIGTLLALVLPHLRLSLPVRIVAGWVGVAAIVSCGFLLQVSRVFPGYAALWPTLAATLVITAGSTKSPFGVDRWLGSRALVYLGSISYCIYLWHFPLLIFVRAMTDPGQISVLTGAAIIVSSIGLAALTTRFVERPIRTSNIGQVRVAHGFALGAACVAPVAIGLAAWSALYVHVRHTQPRHLDLPNSNYPGAYAREPAMQRRGLPVADVFPGPLAVDYDREMLDGPNCDPAPEDPTPRNCVLTGSTGMFTLAVVGGSHSAQWLPALTDLARRSGWQLVVFTKSNCPFFLHESVSDNEVSSCRRWNENVLQRLIELRPDAVFTTSTRHEETEFVPEGYINAWRALEARNIRVLALRDNPDFEFDASACVELHGASSPQCTLSRSQLLAATSPVELLRNPPKNVRFLDLTEYFCDRSSCPPVIGNVLVYRHRNHITASYVRTLEPMLMRELRSAMVYLAGIACGDSGGHCT